MSDVGGAWTLALRQVLTPLSLHACGTDAICQSIVRFYDRLISRLFVRATSNMNLRMVLESLRANVKLENRHSVSRSTFTSHEKKVILGPGKNNSFRASQSCAPVLHTAPILPKTFRT